jgi:predicted dehydrogenase
MQTAVRWGFLGTGMIARKVAAELPAARRAELIAVGSRSVDRAQQFADMFASERYGSYETVLADPDVDAVYVSLPNGLHAEWSMRALRAGKHVLCEKPLARNHAEAEAMFATARECERFLVEAFMYRCNPAIERLIELVRDGAVGSVRVVRTNFTFHRPVASSDARYHPQQAGGALMDVGCYCVNLSRAVVGREPSRVHCVAHVHESGVDDYAAGVLDFQGETVAAFTCGMTVPSDRRACIAGSEGYIQLDDPWFADGQLTLVRRAPQGERPEAIRVEVPRGQYALQLDAFAATVLDGAPPRLAPEDSLGNMQVLDALRASAGLGY